MKKRTALGRFSITLFLVGAVFSCQVPSQNEEPRKEGHPKRDIEDIRQVFNNPENKNVFIIAHRGDWRNAPENSLQAILNCIDLGIDAVEIDVRRTKDSVLVLMHDETITRTTNGEGKVSDLMFDSLASCKLRNGAGYITDHKVPRLEEALKVAKGRIMIDLDIKGEVTLAEIYPYLKKTRTISQVFTGSYDSLSVAKEKFGPYLDSIFFVPALRESSLNVSSFIKDYENKMNPPVFAIKFKADNSPLVRYLDTLKSLNNRIWMHSISSDRSGGHHDDRAVLDPEGSYGWLIKNGIGMIQTDRPRLLLDYLRGKGLHD